MSSTNGHKSIESKAVISTIIFASFEGIGLLLSDSAGAFSGYSLVVVHWLAGCCFVAGPFGVWYEMSNGSCAEKFKRIWFWYFLACVLAAVMAFLIWKPEPIPKPHFIISLRFNDSDSAIILTNDCLTTATAVSTVTNFDDGFMFFNGISTALLFVPIQAGVSNVTYNFNIKNDSLCKVNANDVQFIVSFPKDWKIGVDKTRWGIVKEHLHAPEGELDITNLQCLGMQNSQDLFPDDSAFVLPITNFNISLNDAAHPSAKIESIGLYIRTTGYDKQMAANILYIRQESDFSKPFLLPIAISKNGGMTPAEPKWQYEKEFKNSQK